MATDLGAVGVPATTTPSTSSTSPVLPTDASGGNSRFGFCVFQGPRASMEDAVDSAEQLGSGNSPTEFYAVYDGHSGQQAVEFVKRRLPGIVVSQEGYEDTSKIEKTLCDAFVATDAELIKFLQGQRPVSASQSAPSTAQPDAAGYPSSAQPDPTGYVLSSGSCACIALVRDNKVHVANLGDCRAVLCSNGDFTNLTVDHSAESNPSERERLRGLGVEVSNDGYLHGRIGVSRAFGDWAWDAQEKCRGLLCDPEVTCGEVTEDTEFLLLGCDGIFENMTAKEAGQIVRRRLRTNGDPKDAAEFLVKNASKRDGSDNLSALVVLFRRPAPEPGRAAPRLFGGAKFKLSEEPT